MASPSSARKLFEILFALSIQRCRLSGALCRLTVSLKSLLGSQPQSVRIAISDTGVGSAVSEFRDLAFPPNDKWDGMLFITTTGIHEKYINHYRLNVGEDVSSGGRLTKLPPMHKNVGTFSGTEVWMSTAEEGNLDDLVEWVVRFVRKMLILKVANITIEILVEHTSDLGSRCECVLQEADNSIPSMSMPSIEYSIEHLVSGLGDYVLKHGNVLSGECQSCFPSREYLKIGSGLASSTENIRGTGKVTEAVVMVAAEMSQTCCCNVNCPTTQVLYFQDYSPCSIPHSSVNALTNIDWQSYGFRVSDITVDVEGNAVFEWESYPMFGQIIIALHVHRRRVLAPEFRQCTPSDRNLVKKAVKFALDDLKTKHTGLFLSSQTVKIQEYAPDLSKAIAGLIISSDDMDFKGDCSALLGIGSVDAATEESIGACIREKIISILEMNDRKPKIPRDNAPCLFDCEVPCEDDYTNEDDEDTEHISILDI